MDELVEEFLVEAKDGLEVLDNDLLALEQSPDDKELIDNLFRVMHTIKGTCGFLGLARLASVAHAGENILDQIRDGKLNATPEIISALLEANDVIKDLVATLEEHGEEPEGDDKELIGRINVYAEGGTPAAAEASTETTAEVESGSQDSDELQAIFDSTECLVDADSPAAKPKASSFEGDCEELQAIFDSTEPLVAAPENKGEPQAKAAPPPSGDGSEDSDELQALFDATECLTGAEHPVAEAAQEPEKEPEKAKAPKKEKETKPAEKPAQAKDAVARSAPVQTIRVGLDVLEDLMQQASELVLTRNQLLQILRADTDSVFSPALQRLNHITTELQEGVMKTRMQPVGSAWTKLPRIVRDLSIELNKKIDLKMEGEDTELDRQLLDAIRDPLTHMVRNSADHGIETPEERIANDKPETGTIELKAYQAGGYIIIEISDDGKGIDAEVIRSKAVEKGLISEADAENMPDQEIYQFLFAPGFSTAEKITAVSGRGVGMDVVKSNIEKISGVVELQSTVGKGSRFIIRIPLTLAIMSVLKITAGEERFAIPQINILEIVKQGTMSDWKLETVDGRQVLKIRGSILSLIDLKQKLALPPKKIPLDEDEEDAPKASADSDVDQSDAQPEMLATIPGVTPIMPEAPEPVKEAPKKKSKQKRQSLRIRKNENETYIVICEVAGYRFGIIVDHVEDTEEIVVKPISPLLKDIDIYSGCTILGDGSVILILDPNNLSKRTGETNHIAQVDSHLEEDSNHDHISSFVLFKALDDTPKVIPLELLSRLEEIDVNTIESSRGMLVVQYRDELMRLVKLDPDYEIPKEGTQQVLVFHSNNEIMGLVVEEIVDITKAPMAKNLSSNKEGYLGSIVINGKTCDVVDISHYFAQITDESLNTPEEVEEKKIKILLVDDSPFFRKFIPMELEKEGFEIVTAENGVHALEVISEGKAKGIKAIITDIDMPKMCGNDLLQECRKIPSFADIPIIALSAHSSSRLKSGEEAKGFDGYIPKTNHVDLLRLLQEVLHENAVV